MDNIGKTQGSCQLPFEKVQKFDSFQRNVDADNGKVKKDNTKFLSFISTANSKALIIATFNTHQTN